MTEEELAAKNARNRKAWVDAVMKAGKNVDAVEKADMVAHVSKTGKVGKFRPIPSVVKPSKYKNKKTEVDGIAFDSKKEAARWLELKALEAAGKISRLRRQVQVPLVVSGTCVARWIADFEYYEHPEGSPVWEDVKSEYTRKLPLYRLKNKLVKAIYGKEIRET